MDEEEAKILKTKGGSSCPLEGLNQRLQHESADLMRHDDDDDGGEDS